jgi:Holliday junction resolvase
MKLRWFGKKSTNQAAIRWYRGWTADGMVVVQKRQQFTDSDVETAQPLDAPDLPGLLEQLEDEGFAQPVESGVLVPWDQVYALLANPAFATSLPLLEFPPATRASPTLKSHHSLTDPDFAITVGGWHDGSGRTLAVQSIRGAVIRTAAGDGLLSKTAWETLQHIGAFQCRSAADRTDLFHRRQWGIIRQTALAANARLDDFLYRTVVLTPEKLAIGLRQARIGDDRVVEVQPGFQDAPHNWLEVFDAYREVPNRYDIPTRDGIVQVLITPEVKTVLGQIKRFDRRRIAGSRAEAFVMNPFAALGEDASKVIDPEQFGQERERAGLLFDRFTAHIQHDALGYPDRVGLLIETAGKTGSAIHRFANDHELEAFIAAVERCLNRQLQLCAWSGFELELLGDTPSEIDRLRAALMERQTPRILVSYAQVYDLSRYSARVQNIGVEKPYYSPYITKRKDDEGWFPDNILPLISFLPEGPSEPVVIPLTPSMREQFEAKYREAKAAGQTEFQIKGFPQPIPIQEAEAILQTFAEVMDNARQGTFDPTGTQWTGREDKRLLIKANIQGIDYEEARRDILNAHPKAPEYPGALRAEVRLLDHQCDGVARLQHLFRKSREHHCRGVILADDMGLGKTLQLLALIAWAFERQPNLDPALVVAPVSLLENWEEETRKFFRPDSLPLLTLYGDSVKALRVPRASIDAQLAQEGLVKFLRPGWRQGARLVLTTYETLRDFEFSFAEERWSIMVCDEAQKIKNPNAMVTRSAKKQNVRFKIACTGTPVENTLADLWCLFDFIQPGLLGALNDFGRRYRRPIEARTDQDRERVEELRIRIDPQVIRRTKAQVAKDLPRKIEQDCRIPLSPHQRALYAHAIDLFRKRNAPGALTPFRNHLELLHYLRLICTDPRRHGMEAFRLEPLAEYRDKAPKLRWLLDTLATIQSLAEKVIIFCEFRVIQRLLKCYIEQVFGFSPDIINGDTSASAKAADSRQKRIKAFQAKAGFGAIILSPLAVGFGVNIQAANHVIHYTRPWNPAKEDQATDRAYRIGATKDVYVYYPVIHANDFITFEMKLHELLECKRELADDMLNGAGDIMPAEFDLADVAPDRDEVLFADMVTLDDVLQMRPDYFEGLVAALWQQRGFREVQRTPGSGDDGVDVVAIQRPRGELIQCKTSSTKDARLDWQAIKDVVAGAAAYEKRHPDVRFKKICVTNQFFNANARRHAENNQVELYDQPRLAKLLADHPVRLTEIERFLYTEWNPRGA